MYLLGSRICEVFPLQVMRADTSSSGIAPLIPSLGIRWRRVVNSGTHRIGSLVGPRANLDVLVKGNIFCPYRNTGPSCLYHISSTVTALLRLSCDKETVLLKYTSDVFQTGFIRRFYAAVSGVSGRQTLSHVLSGCDDGYADEANRITKRFHKTIPLTDNCSRNHFRCRIILCFCKRHVSPCVN